MSPVYDDDISLTDNIEDVPDVNGKGERRGLVSYEILSIQPGTYLPEICIRITDPEGIDLGQVQPWLADIGTSSTQLVKLVK